MGMSSLNEEGFRCECPSGMVGDGIGSEGCHYSNATLCHADTCYNQGTCQVQCLIIKSLYKKKLSTIFNVFRIFRENAAISGN